MLNRFILLENMQSYVVVLIMNYQKLFFSMKKEGVLLKF